jgi:hypothetical protein
MSDEYKDKLKSLGFIAKDHPTKTTKVRRDDDGTTAGFQTEHKDGRVDATITPMPVVTKSRPQSPGGGGPTSPLTGRTIVSE